MDWDALEQAIRNQATIECGGTRLYDGANNHLLHNPSELIALLKGLSVRFKDRPIKILELGFSNGFFSSIVGKVLNVHRHVAVDNFSGKINGNTLLGNLRFKNLLLVCNSSTSDFSQESVETFAPYDILFIDSLHVYDHIAAEFNLYGKKITNDGAVIFHDLSSDVWPDVRKYFDEIKDAYKHEEIFHNNTAIRYGYGILYGTRA